MYDRRGGPAFREVVQHRAHERHHLLRFSTRDEVAVIDHRLVEPHGPSVDHIVHGCRGHEVSMRPVSSPADAQEPRAVTERRDWFAGHIERFDEIASGRGRAQQICPADTGRCSSLRDIVRRFDRALNA
jgi:hypothetical protein